MTLAGDAANSTEAAQVFYTAAWDLIGLERFSFAEELLRAAVHADPTHVESQCQLGLVLNRLGHPNEAEEYLKRVRTMHQESNRWLGALGRVYKDMWRDTWWEVQDLQKRQSVCLDHQARVYEGLDLYKEHLKRDPKSHYAAINICAIATWLRHAAAETNRQLDRNIEKLRELSKKVVNRVDPRDLADSGDRGYWACTSLAELALCEGDIVEAVRQYKRAVHWPGRGKFDIRSMLSHLYVYEHIGYESRTTAELIELLEKASENFSSEEVYDKAVLCIGHMTDDPENPGDLSEDVQPKLKQEFESRLDNWEMKGARHLALCRGVRGAETIFAEVCAGRGMKVCLLIPLPEDEFIQSCVHVQYKDWQSRYTHLIANENVEVKYQDHELGAAPPTSSAMQRGLLWCLNTARVAVKKPNHLYLIMVRTDDIVRLPSGFHASLDELVRLPAIRTDIDPARLSTCNEAKPPIAQKLDR
jgi:tetratricopeptide (TPR) repeat protein